ncbi:hypothetical protein [Streptacidiphilus neutrinimicus]|uniref:hypothetical protein n=1 Tax=Streptacidiphilus neutrinimicus TaxID=105420 RepID=UPI0005AA5221|nr:hypothetical protein [Streptacidiphilus neutrinimicus]
MTTDDTISAADLADAMAEMLGMPIGTIWECESCPMESYRIHYHPKAAQHDAVSHLQTHHLLDLDGATLRLQPAHNGDRELRDEYRRDAARGPGDPEIERVWPGPTPLSSADHIGCDMLGCPADADHRLWW